MSNLRKHGEVLHGQLYDNETGLVLGFTEQMQNCDQGGIVPAIGQEATEVIPNDANSSKVKVFLTDDQQESLLDLFYGPLFTTIDNIRLPDELRGITVIFSRSHGDGADASGGGVSGIGPYSLSNSSRSTASGGIVADVQPNIRPHWLDNVDGELYFFYSSAGTSTKAEILARLTVGVGVTVNAWPNFFPDPLSIAVFGENISLSANGSAQQSVNSSGGFTYSTGAGSSIEVQPSVRSLDLSATLHRTLVITTKSDSVDIDVAAAAGWTGSGSFPTRTGGASVPTQTINASVSPTQISATSPANVPVTGKYLYNVRVQKYQVDLFLYTATIVDATRFQSPIIDFNYNGGAITVPDGTAVSFAPDFHGGFPDSYALHTGTLPAGLSLNTSTGIISGTTGTATVATVVIRATNALTTVADASFTITVAS